MNGVGVAKIKHKVPEVGIYFGGHLLRGKKEANQKASRLCDELGLIPLAGSDAHDIGEIGRCPMRVPDDVSTPEDLAKALKSGACEII